MNIIYRFFGFWCSATGILWTRNKFAKFIAELAVREGSLRRIQPNLYATSKKMQ
jgi:hypothetical protein